MPPRGYVNFGTSMKIEDAEILRQKLAQLGFGSLHSLLEAILEDEINTFTSKLTGKPGNEKPQNELVSAKMVDRAGFEPATFRMPSGRFGNDPRLRSSSYQTDLPARVQS